MLATAAMVLIGLATPLAACVKSLAASRPLGSDRSALRAGCASCPELPGFAVRGAGQQRSGAPPKNQPAANAEVHALHVQGNVWMLVGGGGGNVTVQAGDDGVLLVDTSLASLSDAMMAEIKKISRRPVNYIINTHVLDITVPRDKQEGGTYVIPGHGRLCDEHDVLEYRDMLTIVRDRVQDGVKKGMTFAQVKAARPTLDYDARWGSNAGPQTTDQFLEKIFNEMRATRP